MSWHWYFLQSRYLSCWLIIILILCRSHSAASPISSGWVEATVRIESEENTGTGFLISRRSDNNVERIFLVTNKHVFGENVPKRQLAKTLKVFVNVRHGEKAISGASIEIHLSDGALREHPNSYVDVLAVDITQAITDRPDLKISKATYSDFITSEIRERDDVTIADEILIIGFPDPFRAGLAHARINYPLVRQGIIASKIGEPIMIPVEETDSKIKLVEVRGFLVDATVIPGSSGSPVVLKPARAQTILSEMGHISFIPEKKPYLLGIVSSTKLTRVKVGKDRDGKHVYLPALAGLGVVYDADTIRETLELFLVE